MSAIQNRQILRFSTEGVETTNDDIAVEEPLEIVVAYGDSAHRQRQTIAITMRTPTDDFSLALGFLFTEGVIFSKNDVLKISYLDDNRILVDLHERVVFNTEKLNRHFYTTSSCGVCGKASLDAVTTHSCFILRPDFPSLNKNILLTLSTQLLENQSIFNKTGGVHAAFLYSTEGVLEATHEDVGRHNALDKIVGWAFQEALLPLDDRVLLVSGRVSFELVQKAAMAGIPLIVAIGAPSSLAIALADEMNMTLIGFLKPSRFNIYTGEQRLK